MLKLYLLSPVGPVHHKLRSIVTLVVTFYINLLPAHKINNLSSIFLLILALTSLIGSPGTEETSNLTPLFHDLGKLMITSIGPSKICNGGRKEAILRVVCSLDW